MEFMKVIVPEREGREINVLINGEQNGMIGETLIFGREIIMVSVNLPAQKLRAGFFSIYQQYLGGPNRKGDI